LEEDSMFNYLLCRLLEQKFCGGLDSRTHIIKKKKVKTRKRKRQGTK